MNNNHNTGWLAPLAWIALLFCLLSGCSTPEPFHGGGRLGSETGVDPISNNGIGLPEPQGPIATLEPGTDEVWVIARPGGVAADAADQAPDAGSLTSKTRDATASVILPLKHTSVKAMVEGHIATVEVTQQFHNPSEQKIEAAYTFPLPHNGAVNEFIMTVGDRRIRGIIRERSEAQEIYQQALRMGHVASLLTQERPDTFTQHIANIEPGRSVEIQIRYFNTLSFDNGWYEFVFPLAMGRQHSNPTSSAAERTGKDISLSLELRPGVNIEEWQSRSHEVIPEVIGQRELVVRLPEHARIANRDFVFRYRVAGSEIKSNLIAHRDADQRDGGYFTLMLYPPESLRELSRRPVELIFCLDASGGMRGYPLAQAKAAVEAALGRLRPEDTFQVVALGARDAMLADRPIEASPANLQRAFRFLQRIESGGEGGIHRDIESILNTPGAARRLRFVVFLSDGRVGSDRELLATVHRNIGSTRVFSVGIGSSPNRHLLDHLARIGAGAVAYLGPSDPPDEAMDNFLERISRPALTEIQINWNGMLASEVFPRRVPDLFVGRPVILTGKFQGPLPSKIIVRGRSGFEFVEFEIPVTQIRSAGQESRSSMPAVWARQKMTDLAARSIIEPSPAIPELIKLIALDHGLMSPFTSFGVVDAASKTSTALPVRVESGTPTGNDTDYERSVDVEETSKESTPQSEREKP